MVIIDKFSSGMRDRQLPYFLCKISVRIGIAFRLLYLPIVLYSTLRVYNVEALSTYCPLSQQSGSSFHRSWKDGRLAQL